MLASLNQWLIVAMTLSLGLPSGANVLDEVAIASLAPNEQLLVREYARNWPNVFDFYSSMALEGAIYDESRIDQDAQYVILSEFRGTVKILNSQMFRLTGRLPDGSSGMVIATPTDVYGFGWNDEKHKYFLASRFATSSVFMDQFISKYAFHIEPFSNGEFQRFVFGIPQTPGQTVTVESVDLSQEDGEEIATATVICRGENKGENWTHILLFSFLRNKAWAKHTFLSAFPDASTRTYSVSSTRCIYEGEHNEIPLLKECIRESGVAPFSDASIDHSRFFAPSQVMYFSRSRAVADKFIPGPPNLSEFDPKPYLESIGGLGKSKQSVWQPLFLFSNAGVLLLIGVLLLRRAKRYSNDNESTTDAVHSNHIEVNGTYTEREVTDV